MVIVIIIVNVKKGHIIEKKTQLDKKIIFEIHQDNNSKYRAECKIFNGSISTQGNTLEDLVENIKEAISLSNPPKGKKVQVFLQLEIII